MTFLQGILTPEQRSMGMTLQENDHCVNLLINGKKVVEWNATTVTFTTIQSEAYQKEQELVSGICVVPHEEFVKARYNDFPPFFEHICKRLSDDADRHEAYRADISDRAGQVPPDKLY